MSATAVPCRAVPLPAQGPYRLAQALVAGTLVLITLGGMVTSTGSGMAFRDWPLADGSLWPEDMTLSGFLEHVHRAAGALVGLMVLALTLWIGLRERRRPWLRRVAIAGLGLVVAQGVLGGVGVLWELPALTSVSHAVLAQVTLCTLTFLAFCLSPGFALRRSAPAAAVRAARKATAAAMVLLLVQLVLGAVARHTGSGQALWSHVGLAGVVFLTLLVAAAHAAGRLGHVPGVRGGSRLVLGLLAVQVVLGFVALLVRTGKDPANIELPWRSALITGHVLVGALLALAMALLVFRVFRCAVPAAVPGESRE